MGDDTAAHMAQFWDERARENANYFVDNRLDYNAGDDEAFWREGETDLARLLEATGATVWPASTVLDIGCGVGRLTRALASRFEEVHGIDVSAEMVRIAGENLSGVSNVKLHVGDGVSLKGIPDQSMDAVVSLVVFQHIPDPKVTLGYVVEIGRVLKPGGWAAFQVSDDPTVHTRQHKQSRIKIALGRAPKGQDDPAWRGSAVSYDAIRGAAYAAGMEVAQAVGHGTQFLLVRLVKE